MDLSTLEIDIVVEKCKKSIFTAQLEQLGVQFYILEGKFYNIFSHFQSLQKLMRKRKYDLIHLHIYQAIPLFYLGLARKMQIPIRIAHSHNTMLRNSGSKELKMLLHRVAKYLFTKYSTELWACSASAAEFMFRKSELEQKGYRIIPNAISLKRFQRNDVIRTQMRQRLQIANRFVIGHIGRLCAQKNQSFLLDIFAHIHQRDTSACLLLVGDGEDRIALKQKAHNLGIMEDVLFYGTSTQVENLLWTMDIFVFPSLFEGLGIAAIEAQAAGLPVICSDRIPDEAVMTNLVQRIPLYFSAEQWAQKILETYRENIWSNFNALSSLRKSGFEVTDLGKWMKKVYTGEIVVSGERTC